MNYKTAVLWNLLLVRFLCFWTGAPVGATGDKRLLRVDGSLLKRLLWAATLTVLGTRSVVMVTGIGLTLTLDRFRNPLYVPFYLIGTSAVLAACYCGYTVLNCEAGNFVLMWNTTLKHKSRVRTPELLAWFFSCVGPSGYGLALSFSAFLLFKPQLPIQLSFGVRWALEEGFLTVGPTYCTLVVMTTVVDFWSILICAGILFTLGPSQMIFLEMWSSALNWVIQRSADTPCCIEVELVCSTLQELQVALRIFNVANSGFVFAIKIALLIESISGAVAMMVIDFDENFFLLGFLSYVTFAAPFFYPAMYHRAPAVSEGLQRAKSELLQVREFSQLDPSFERRLRGISSNGVQVGGFRTFERESDLIYWDFIVTQVVDIVLAWKN